LQCKFLDARLYITIVLLDDVSTLVTAVDPPSLLTVGDSIYHDKRKSL
jgi:hypothetical protein